MKKWIFYFGSMLLFGACEYLPVETTMARASENELKPVLQNMKTLHNYSSRTLDGKEFDFSTLQGKRVLIVNTASECGYTPQYKQLQDLYAQYKNHGFVIIGFPSNDFGGQEPGSNKEIAAFCEKNYGVTFPLMDKTSVKGDNRHPVYQWLTEKSLNGVKDVEVKWNFNKFLIDENGKWIAYYPSGVEPLDEKIVSFAEGHVD